MMSLTWSPASDSTRMPRECHTPVAGSGVYVAIAGGVLIAVSGYRLWEARKQTEPDFTPADEKARARVGGDW